MQYLPLAYGQGPYALGYTSWPAAAQPAAPVAAELARLQQQLLSIEAAINGILASLAPPPPPAPPTPWWTFDWLFGPSPVPTPVAPPPAVPPTPPAPARATNFTISSFNVLGSSHTKAGGEKPGMASGPARIHGVVDLLAKHHVDVVGFQELQGDQLREFQKLAGDKYAVYPGNALGKRETVNSIAWRKDTWELVRPDTIEIPYFNGAKRKMPVVRLRNKATGQEAYFANFHNPADTHRFHHQQKWRDLGTTAEIALVNRLTRETGLPVFITGDMNEGKEYYDRMTRGAPMKAAITGPGGRLPRRTGIDWIFGSLGVTFKGFTRDESALVKRTTDHPMVISQAQINR